MFERNDTLLAADHVAGSVLVVEPGLDLHDDFPGLRLVAREVVLGVLDEQGIDVHHMPLDQQVVGPLPQLDECTGDDVDEAPGELAKRRGIALAGELAGNARGHLADATKPAHGVVTGGNIWPAEVKNIELAFASGAFGLDIHALEQVRIALGVEDDDHFVLANCVTPPDVLGDEQLGESCFAHPRGAQDE